VDLSFEKRICATPDGFVAERVRVAIVEEVSLAPLIFTLPAGPVLSPEGVVGPKVTVIVVTVDSTVALALSVTSTLKLQVPVVVDDEVAKALLVEVAPLISV
jgi:hypothetical protein